MIPLLSLALIDCLAGTAFATVFSASLLTLPAVLGVRRLLSRRWASPFARGALERQAVFLACLVGAASAVAWADGTALAITSDVTERAELASLLLSFVAPVPLAAVPWMAGELLSGTSLRQVQSLLSAMATSCAASWATYALCWNGHDVHFSVLLVPVQLACAALSVLLAGTAYLATRGAAVDDLHAAAVELERL